MSTYLDSFRSLGLGFDAMFDALEAFDSLTPPRDNYPPYNLIRDGDNYTLEVALAGRKKEENRTKRKARRKQLLSPRKKSQRKRKKSRKLTSSHLKRTTARKTQRKTVTPRCLLSQRKTDKSIAK